MCDFNLSDALPSPLELEDTVVKPCCVDMTPHHVQDGRDSFFRLDDGLGLVISHSPETMECVATLLLAVNRMKKLPSRGRRKLSDNELCSVIMDSLVEETIVEKTVSFSTGQKSGTFLRLNSGEVVTLCDDDNKDIIQGMGEVKLQAVTLKGGHTDRKVNFKLAKYTNPCSTGDGETVQLSITNTNLHISCSMEAGRAILQLERYSKDQLQEITDDGKTDRFLFYKRFNGTLSIITFESVMCRGWFISTHETENQPVEMCKVDAAQRVTRFKQNLQ